MTHTDSLSWQYLDTEQAARAALPGLIQASQASDADSDPGQQAQRLACLLTAYGTLQQLDRVACVAQDLRHCISRGHGLIWRGVLMYHEALLDEPSDPAMALQRLEMAVDQALAQGDPVLAVRALHRMGRVYRVVGDLQGALRAREQGLDIARANDLLREVPSLLIGRGICLFALQRDAEAVDSLEAAALMAAGQSRWNVAANAISGVVEHWVEQGEIVRADEALQRGRQYQKKAGEDSIARREMAVSEAVVLHEQGQQEHRSADQPADGRDRHQHAQAPPLAAQVLALRDRAAEVPGRQGYRVGDVRGDRRHAERQQHRAQPGQACVSRARVHAQTFERLGGRDALRSACREPAASHRGSHAQSAIHQRSPRRPLQPGRDAGEVATPQVAGQQAQFGQQYFYNGAPIQGTGVWAAAPDTTLPPGVSVEIRRLRELAAGTRARR